MDVPAELIAEIYKLRWLIELFFRMFKQLLKLEPSRVTKRNSRSTDNDCPVSHGS